MKQKRLDVVLGATSYLMTRHTHIVQGTIKGCQYCVAQSVVRHLEMLLEFQEIQLSDVLNQTYQGLLAEWIVLAKPPQNDSKTAQIQAFKRLNPDRAEVFH